MDTAFNWKPSECASFNRSDPQFTLITAMLPHERGQRAIL